MGRYSTEISVQPQQNNDKPANQLNNNFQQNYNWPDNFPLTLISVDLNGTLIEDNLLTGPQSVNVLPGVLESIRLLRLKGHKFFILSDQPEIGTGKLSVQQYEQSFEYLMKLFGDAGIQTIDGMLYNNTNLKNDEFAKPNTGMIKRAENQIFQGIKFKGGYHVGDSIEDLKMADKARMQPVLVLTGKGINAEKELQKYSNKELKKKTLIFTSFVEFAQHILKLGAA